MTSQHSKTSVAAISIFASGGMAAAKFAVGIAIGSLALISEALHSSIDLIVGLILAALGYWWGDAAAAAAVAVMIALLGLRMAGSTVQTLVDRAPEGALEQATAAICGVPGVIDVERLRVRMVGATYFI